MVCQGILFVVFRAPRFKGFQQQDSHELLRHLMDGMKAEEIKVLTAATVTAPILSLSLLLLLLLYILFTLRPC